ncbi:MAG: ATP-binding cassette domain-containing protein [Candidatus Manganitrophus sp.]|nr:MAG: ATP-binding cassette domain-containing protein [Candidatus Manganitrophus sp.]
MGRNGMGKTTLFKALMGMLPSKGGTITLDGTDLAGLDSHRRVRSGMAYVPQGRMIFPTLTVEENIQTGLEKSKHQRDARGHFERCFRCCSRCATARAAISPAASSSNWRSPGRW